MSTFVKVVGQHEYLLGKKTFPKIKLYFYMHQNKYCLKQNMKP